MRRGDSAPGHFEPGVHQLRKNPGVPDDIHLHSLRHLQSTALHAVIPDV